MPRALLAAGFACFATLGLRDGALGVAWPSMRESFGQPLSALGLLVVVGTGGYLAAALASGRLNRHVAPGSLLAVGSGLTCLALLAYAVAPVWGLLVGLTAVLVAGSGLLDVGVNAAAARWGSVRALGLLHAAYGIGALGGPLLVTALLAAGSSWRWCWAVLAALEAPVLVVMVRSRRGWDEQPPATPGVLPADAPGEPSPAPAATTWLAPAVFFLYVGMELAGGQWAYSSLALGRGLAPTPAGIAAAGYYLGLLAGRLTVAAAGGRLGAARLLLGGTGLAAVGSAVFWAWPGPVAGSAGLALTGAGLAPVFPALVSLTPAASPAEAAGGVGRRFAAGALGAALLPAGAGLLLDRVALTALAPALLGADLVLALLAALLLRPGPTGGPTSL